MYLTDDRNRDPKDWKSQINMGLNIKFRYFVQIRVFCNEFVFEVYIFSKRNEEVPDYTKKVEETWTYSLKVAEILQGYIEK